jgi:hypothetical protein
MRKAVMRCNDVLRYKIIRVKNILEQSTAQENHNQNTPEDGTVSNAAS